LVLPVLRRDLVGGVGVHRHLPEPRPQGLGEGPLGLLVLVLPIVGILAYFIFRGDQMRAHQTQARYQEQSFRDYAFHGSGGHLSPAEELSRLAELKRDGVISEDEFQKLKSRVIHVGSDSGAP
jgi:hypothetical protein